MDTQPTNAMDKYIFIVDNTEIAQSIILAGFKSVFLANEDSEYQYSVSTFLDYLDEISHLGKYRMDYIYIPACGTKKTNNALENYFGSEYLKYHAGWRLFKDKEYLANHDRGEELKKNLDAFIKRFEGNDKDQQMDLKLPKLICMADVEEKEAEWLIPGYIPKGSITILAGDGGSGKTTTWCGIAAAVSAGTKVFFDTVPDAFAKCEPQKVLFFSSEDSIEHTLRTRLRKAGAKLENILSISLQDEFFGEIKFDSPILEKLLEQEKPALVIFDPVQSFIPPSVQMGQRNAMRSCLNPLIGWGEKYGCTFIIVVHTNKRQGVFGRNRVADSADIWDIARSVLIAECTQDDRRYLSHEKSNYGEPGATALFTINEGVAIFEEYSDKKDKDFVGERDFETRQAPQRADAEQFICDFLKNGKKPTKELDEAAKAAGISNATLRRAKEQLKNKKILGLKSEGNGKNKLFYSFLLESAS